MQNFSTIAGALAALCSVASFVPQAWKIIRTRRTKDLSAAMYSLTVVGFTLWTAYGLILGQWPLIACNGICLLISCFILAMKVLPSPTKNRVADSLDPNGGVGRPSGSREAGNRRDP